MIEETARVVACQEGFAIVETQSRVACGGCSAQTACTTSVLSSLFKRRHKRLKVLNPIQAIPGQRVVIGLQERALVVGSLMVYLMPLLGLILLAIGLQELADYLQWRSGELASILGGLVGLLGGLLLAGAYTRRHQHDGSYQAMILRQLPDAQDKFA